MKFSTVTFSMSTSATGNHADGIATTVTLTESDVPDEVVAASAIAGQSPRVAWGGRWRVNGTPKAITMPWLEWFGKPRAVLVVTPESAEAQINALSPAERRVLLENALAKLAAAAE